MIKNKKFYGVLLFSIITLLLPGCGGGSGESANIKAPNVVITEDNFARVSAGTVEGVGEITDLFPGNTIENRSIGGGKRTPRLFISILNTALSIGREQRSQYIDTRSVYTYSCDNNGSYSIDERENGTILIYSYNKCEIQNVYLNGVKTISIKNDTTEIHEINDFDIVFDDIFHIHYDHTEITIKTDSNDTLKSIKSLFNGYLEWDDGTIYQYNNIDTTLDFIEKNETNETDIHLVFNGLMSTPCTTGWVEARTVETIILSGTTESCPTAGKVDVYGAENTKSRIVFKSDGSVEVQYGDISEDYENCYDMDYECSVQ